MIRHRIAAIGCLAAITLHAATAAAQDPDAAPAAQAPQRPATETEIDLLDVIRMLRHKDAAAPAEPASTSGPMLAFVPTISSKPSTGLSLGVLAHGAFYLGDPATTGISTTAAGLNFTTKKQASLTVRLNVFTRDNHLDIQGDNRFLWTSQDTFGLGLQTTESDAINARFDHFRVSEIVYRAMRPGLYVGAGLHFNAHRDIRPGTSAEDEWDTSPYVEYSQRYGFSLEGQASNGPAFGLLFDTRDNVINASRGWMAALTYRPYFEALGSDSAWQEIVLDVRTYRRLTQDGRHLIAMWAYGDLVADGVAPYFALPSTGNDTYGRAGRGYVEGRFRGDRLAYGELEYRGTLMANGLLGMVAFLNATTVSNRETGESLFDDLAPGGGVGLRVRFNKRSRTNICIDVGWGRGGSRGLYLGLQEAF
jgi:Omp85 superfamily domain